MAKSVYACIDNVSRNIKQIPVCVDGVSRNTKEGWTYIDGVSRQFFGGSTISDLEVGQSVFMNVNGLIRGNEYMIIHKGLPSSAYDSSCDGIWVLRKYTYENYYWSQNNTGAAYKDSTIHQYLNSTVLSKFSTDIQNIIKQVQIPSITYNSNTVSAKLFLLSYTEVFGGNVPGLNQPEGAILDYFNGATAEDRRGWTSETKQSANAWWLRNQYNLNSSGAFLVNSSGTAYWAMKNSVNGHYRFAMILPHDTRIDENFNIIA